MDTQASPGHPAITAPHRATLSSVGPGLHHLPLPLFAAPMGVGGLGLAWREAGHVLGAPALAGKALLLARLLRGPALPPKLRPTLAILLAPPAVGALALAVLTGGFGPAALAAFGLAAFLALVLAMLWRDLSAGPFAMSWWGWTFASAAFVVAALQASAAHPAAWQGPLLWARLAAASVILAVVAAGHLLRPEG